MEEFWGGRLVALIIDVIFIMLLMWVLTAISYLLIAGANLYAVYNYWFIVWGLLTVLYFLIMEGKWSTTLGKGPFNLEVKYKEGAMDYKKALQRNVSKFLLFPLIIDLVVGFSRNKDRKQRYLDQVAGTQVIKVE